MMRFDIFNGAAVVEHRGVAWGDASYRAPDALDKIRRLAREHDLDDVVLPQLNFAHRVISEDELERLDETLLKAQALGDGVALRQPRRGVFIANGDCAVGVLQSGATGEAVVMHLGLNCLWRADGGPTLMELALEALGGPAGEARFWVGCAIGPCCHGYAHDRPEHVARARQLKERFGEDVIGGRVERGPRRGQVAYDHRLMAARSAARLGVSWIEEDPVCRACAGLLDDQAPYGDFFSNTRDTHGGRERNAALIYLRGWGMPV